MDNYQTETASMFPSSSSTLNMVMNSHGYHHGFEDDKSTNNGYMGISSNMGFPNLQVNDEDDQDVMSQNKSSNNFVVGGGADQNSSNEIMKMMAKPEPPGGYNSGGDGGSGGRSSRSGGKREKKVKKPRYAFQTRSQVDILDDGYRWRKYGQKAVKNNKFPRSYYRCTHQGCNVKKQVQRLSKDEGVVVTTYEGMHSHPIEKSTDNFEHILTQMQIYTTI